MVESTFSWYWLVNGLMEAGYRAHRVNVTAIKKHEGLNYANDKTDAAYLGELKLPPEGDLCSGRGDRPRDLSRQCVCLPHCRITSSFPSTPTRMVIATLTQQIAGIERRLREASG